MNNKIKGLVKVRAMDGAKEVMNKGDLNADKEFNLLDLGHIF